MPRPVTARPVGEHLTTLTRVMRQVSVDDGMDPRRRSAVLAGLDKALVAIREEMAAPAKKQRRR